MKRIVSSVALAVWAASALAQGAIYRCGNEFSNTLSDAEAKRRDCKLVSGGNVTVVPAVKQPAAKSGSSPANAPRVDANDQRSKDADARAILEAELRKAEARQAELLKEYNNGEPEKVGPETRNHQKYLDRVAELKRSIERNEADIAGIKRELARVGTTPAANTGTSKF
ncbi:hypothetical protein RQP54_08705 [Curvibacter sp. APW13]|uniref:hypothetical protein n=1 Tax=Curvibacter sp. APW13 TaxID=3077236 RepID=UPI0028DEEE2F|nr:hypothetical protein [Curvibacter sp. APW13]MDT8990942.1 hypothetical protein [Curvibacter sp. APW13]